MADSLARLVGALFATHARMVPRRLQIVDSLLDLDDDSQEADSLRNRRAHLARYAKMAMAGALAICFAAGIRIVASSVVGEPEIEASNATASVSAPPSTPSGADTSARPAPTPADEVLAGSTERVSRFVVHAKKRRH